MVQRIKEILYNDKQTLIDVLEKLGCHKINPHYNNEIRCALPDGETNTSVQIILNEFLPTYVYSRSCYDDYEIKDIISFIQFILQCGFTQAIRWICDELGMEYTGNVFAIRNQSETIQCLKRYIKKNTEVVYNEPMNENILLQYPNHVVEDWVKEGISGDIQTKYGIRIDEKRCRWIVPIRDEHNILVALKGRTYLPNYKELGIPKYIHYKSNKDVKFHNNILFGINYNYSHIKQANEVILFEGEKSVMKAEGLGFNNCVAIGKDSINPHLRKEILKLQTNVVIALDKDVKLSDIIGECRKLSTFTNVFYVFDKHNLLDKKDSPVDKGLGVFLDLYSNKTQVLR